MSDVILSALLAMRPQGVAKQGASHDDNGNATNNPKSSGTLEKRQARNSIRTVSDDNILTSEPRCFRMREWEIDKSSCDQQKKGGHGCHCPPRYCDHHHCETDTKKYSSELCQTADVCKTKSYVCQCLCGCARYRHQEGSEHVSRCGKYQHDEIYPNTINEKIRPYATVYQQQPCLTDGDKILSDRCMSRTKCARKGDYCFCSCPPECNDAHWKTDVDNFRSTLCQKSLKSDLHNGTCLCRPVLWDSYVESNVDKFETYLCEYGTSGVDPVREMYCQCQPAKDPLSCDCESCSSKHEFVNQDYNKEVVKSVSHSRTNETISPIQDGACLCICSPGCISNATYDVVESDSRPSLYEGACVCQSGGTISRSSLSSDSKEKCCLCLDPFEHCPFGIGIMDSSEYEGHTGSSPRRRKKVTCGTPRQVLSHINATNNALSGCLVHQHILHNVPTPHMLFKHCHRVIELKTYTEYSKDTTSGRPEEDHIVQNNFEQDRFGQDPNQHPVDQDRVEPDRIIQLRLEQERNDQNRLNQLRLEQERKELDHIIQFRLEQERNDQNRLNQLRLEQERNDQNRINQFRLEQERKEQDHLNQLRLEQERNDQNRINQFRLEQECKEQDHVAQLRLEQDRIHQNYLENERVDQNRTETVLEQARMKQGRMEQELYKQDRMDQKHYKQDRTVHLAGATFSLGIPCDYVLATPLGRRYDGESFQSYGSRTCCHRNTKPVCCLQQEMTPPICVLHKLRLS